MADQFHSTAGLRDALAEASFDRPPALVANAHVTGVSVARALAAVDVPVVALDRGAGDGVAPPSDAVDFAGAVTYPLDDPDGFRADVASLVAELGTEAVAFPCMDEWVRGFADTQPEGVRLSFDRDVDRVLDKANLYALAEEHGVPYPETRDLTETSADTAIDAVGGFPLVIKPAHKRKFEEAFGTNVVRATDRGEFDDTVQAAREADARVLVQEAVSVEPGRDASLASYRPPADGPSFAGVGKGPVADHDALGVVGNAAVRYPQGFGTSCLVETVEEPAVTRRALSVLDETGYHGISEAEFVYDTDRETYVLLDINTRPWKWISTTVAAGANLPAAAYAATVEGVDPAVAVGGAGRDEVGDARWVYLPDYLELCATTPAFQDALSREEWGALVSGTFEDDPAFTTGVYRPSDPGPATKAIRTAFGGREYYCAC